MCVQQGTPSTFAAMSSSSGPSAWYDSFEPPGMMLGPSSAPSSPPETPAPTKWMPRSRSAASRLRVSRKCAFPPSTSMSPGSSRGANSSITASVGAPALTMIKIRRGRSSAATKSSGVSQGTKVPSSPYSSISALVLCWDLLCTATECPCLARLRARFAPITASPVTPI